MSLGSNLWALMCAQTFADCIEVTLADEDINSIQTNDVNPMHCGNASGAMRWPKLKLMHGGTTWWPNL